MTVKKQIPRWVGDLLLLITAIIWGGGFVAVEQAVNNIPPFYLITMRFAIGTIGLGIWQVKKLKQITKEELKIGSIVGIFLFLGFATQTTSAVYISAGKLAFLTALNVVCVPFFAHLFYKEKLSKKHLFSSFLALIGAGFLSLGADNTLVVGTGEILGVLCAVGFAMHITMVGYYSKKIDGMRLTLIQMAVCMLLAFVFALVLEEPPKNITAGITFSILYIGIGCTCLGFLFQTLGQKYTCSARAALILCLESVFGTLFSVLILKEIITVKMFIGCMLIFAGVLIAECNINLTKIKKTKNALCLEEKTS